MKTNKFNDDLYDAVQNGEITIESEISIDVFNGPIGGYGFRSGNWPVRIGGITFTMYGSLPHQLELDKQRERLENSVREKIKHAVEGETYVNKYSGNTELRYVSQMKRV